MMERDQDWEVVLMPEDALLMQLAPDGTMRMRAVALWEWNARLAERAARGSCRFDGEVVQQLLGHDDPGAERRVTGPSSERAATQ